MDSKRRSPLWGQTRTSRPGCPFRPHGRTSSGRPGMSEKCRFCCKSLFEVVNERFSEPLMRLKNGDVRDQIVSSKIDQGAPSGVAKQRSSREVKKSTFARFLGSFDFRLLQQYGTLRTSGPRPSMSILRV